MVHKDNHWESIGILFVWVVIGNILFMGLIAVYDRLMPNVVHDSVGCYGDYSPLGSKVCE